MQILVDGLPIAYAVHGSGRPIVLLHGWADSAKTWRTLEKQLQKNYTVITLDLPGFGDSATPPEGWGLPEYAACVRNFLQKLQINDVHALVGHSNGGAIAIYAVAHHIVDVERLVLLASSGVRAQATFRKQAFKLVAKVGKGATLALPRAKRQELRTKLYASMGSDYLVSPHMQEVFKKIVAHDIQAEATRVHIPTLLIYGTKDDATPLAHGQLLHAAIQGSKLVSIKDAGHFIHHDAPEQVTKSLQEFLS